MNNETATDLLAPDLPRSMRARVEALESQIEKLPQAECPVRHLFAPGIYAREMTIPAGVVLTGAVHRTEHLNIVSKGRITVSTDDGMKEVCAPFIFVSKPGTKRVGYAHEETVWTTIHATTTTDLDELVEELTESTAQQLLGGSENAQLLHERKELEK
ncbi:hypothetical protein LGN09_23930 [Burkholderia cenocepacia]|uniref:hypothetical protein n=1 Tax=Burkholderia cenocepacia TaxID=95486 RepID=UPI001CF28A35|nr:hypothetical protein [Burkholderia cenocepacia]MCA8407960.1 hypothetical protein [Burkholderia cenocepacia]